MTLKAAMARMASKLLSAWLPETPPDSVMSARFALSGGKSGSGDRLVPEGVSDANLVQALIRRQHGRASAWRPKPAARQSRRKSTMLAFVEALEFAVFPPRSAHHARYKTRSF